MRCAQEWHRSGDRCGGKTLARPGKSTPVYGLRILADCYLRISKFDKALQLYAVVLQKEPQNHLAKLGSALAQVQLGRVPEALKNYEQVMSANPRMAEVVMDDCLFYVAQGVCGPPDKFLHW